MIIDLAGDTLITTRFNYTKNEYMKIKEYNEYMNKINEYLSIAQAANYLGITPNTLRNWEKNGKIKTHRNPFNNYRPYKKSTLEALLKNIEDTPQ